MAKKGGLKLGDIVWGIESQGERTAKVVRFFEENVTKNIWGKQMAFHYDVIVEWSNGCQTKTECKKLMLADDAVLDLDGKSKWEVNEILGNVQHKVPIDNGYFGAYSVIDYKGQQCIVYVDDRDAKVKVVTNLYDKIYKQECGSWSGDYRWNSDKPLVVYKKRKGYNIIMPHGCMLGLDKWLKNIEPHWYWGGTDLGNYLKGIDKDGNAVYITPKGSVRLVASTTKQNLENVLAACKSMTNDEISELWIGKGMPCAFIRGLEYKGSRPTIVTKERAIELFKTHHNFSKYFGSAEWRIHDAQVILLFREYANSDYD